MLIANNVIVFDFETGGLKATDNPVTEVGIVVYNQLGEIIFEYESFVQGYDGLTYNPKAMEVTGITMSEVNSGITKDELIKAWKDVFQKYKAKGRAGKPILCGHNVKFDIGFLEYLIPDYEKYVDPIPQDTMWLSRLAWGHDDSMTNFKLGTCCDRVGIDLSGAHRALADVKATGSLFWHHIESMRGNAVVVEKSDNAVRFRDGFRLP